MYKCMSFGPNENKFGLLSTVDRVLRRLKSKLELLAFNLFFFYHTTDNNTRIPNKENKKEGGMIVTVARRPI